MCRKHWFGLVLTCQMMACSVCQAVVITEEGNQPRSAANYHDWPGLVNAVNDLSRMRLVWCNGNETLYFSGETADANRVLKAFAATQTPKLEVLILPGTANLVTGTESQERRADWIINVPGGKAGALALAGNQELGMPLHPRMMIYVSDRIDVKQLQIADHLLVTHREDRIATIKDVIAGDNRFKVFAEQELKNLTPDLSPESRLEYERRVANISAWVTHRRLTASSQKPSADDACVPPSQR